MIRNLEALIDRQIQRWNYMSNFMRRQGGKTDQDEKLRASGELEIEQPTHPVICLTRDMGSGASEIAENLAGRLNYEVFGSELIHQIATDLKVRDKLIESLDERSFSESRLIFESWMQGHEIERTDYLQSLGRVIQTLALQGGLIIMGRGAGFILKDHSALNVLLTAPLEDRVQRVAHKDKISPEQARARVSEADYQRRAFIYQHFKADIYDPVHYDLIINTHRTPPLAASELILAALRVRGFMTEQLKVPMVV